MGDDEAPQPAPAEKPCPWCSETVRADALKCKHCGEFFSHQRPKTPTASIYRLLVGLLVAAVVIGGTVFYVQEQDRRERRAEKLQTELTGLSDEQLCELAEVEVCPP